jgi:hypothetical protein
MSDATPSVRLVSNRGYWQAQWLDSTGRKRAKSLGSKAKVSRSRARRRCDKIAAQLVEQPGLRDQPKMPRLGEFLAEALDRRKSLAPETAQKYARTAELLTEQFAPRLPIDQITRWAATRWKANLQHGRLSLQGEDQGPPAYATMAAHVGRAWSMFRDAHDGGLIKMNPFAHLPGATLDNAIESHVDSTIAKLRGESSNAPGEWWSVVAIQRATATGDTPGLTSEQLRKARERGSVEARKVGGRWQYAIESVRRTWPEYKSKLETGQNRTEPDDLESGPFQGQ